MPAETLLIWKVAEELGVGVVAESLKEPLLHVIRVLFRRGNPHTDPLREALFHAFREATGELADLAPFNEPVIRGLADRLEKISREEQVEFTEIVLYAHLSKDEGVLQEWLEKRIEPWLLLFPNRVVSREAIGRLKQELPVTLKASFARVLTEERYRKALIAFQNEVLPLVYSLLTSQLAGLAGQQRQSAEELLERLRGLDATIPMLSAVIDLARGQFIREDEVLGLQLRQFDDDLLGKLADVTPFVGREEALQRLTDSVHSGGYLLVTAPAGGGKSTLLAHCVRSIAQANGVLCYHFFNRNYCHCDDLNVGLACLSEQLLAAHTIKGDVRESDSGRLYRILNKTLSMPHPSPLVVLVDGLDEARKPEDPDGFAFDQGLFPDTLGENTTVILAARATDGENTVAWLKDQLGLTRVEHFPLPELDELAVKALLRRCTKRRLVELADEPNFVGQLLEKTGGLAIYVRYLVDEFDHAQERDWKRVLDGLPSKFEEFVAEIARLHTRIPAWDEALYVLAVAKSPLSGRDLMTLVGLRRQDFYRLPWAVNRWLAVTKGGVKSSYAFQHPAIANGYRQCALSSDESQDYREKLLDFCADWRNHRSPYALRHYAEHLLDAVRTDTRGPQLISLYSLASNEEFQQAQRKEFPAEPYLPLRTVQAALLGASAADDAGAMAKFLLRHARCLMEIREESPLDALSTDDSDASPADLLKRAWALADQHAPERAVLWYLLLVWELLDAGDRERASVTLSRLRERQLGPIPAKYGTVAAGLLRPLVELDTEAFTDLSRRLILGQDEVHVVGAVTRLAEELVETGRYDLGLDLVGQWPTRRNSILGCIALHQARSHDCSGAKETIGRISRPGPAAAAMARVAGEFVKSGNESEGLAYLESALDRARQSGKAYAVAEVALQRGRLGYRKIAYDLIEEIDLPVLATGTLAQIAIDLYERRVNPKRVLKKAYGIANEQREPAALLKVAIGFARTDQASRASKIFKEFLHMHTPGGQEWKPRLVELTEAQAEARQFDEAIRTIEQFPSEERRWKSGSLCHIARLRAEAGEIVAAWKVMADLIGPTRQVSSAAYGTLIRIATLQAETGEGEKARQQFAQFLLLDPYDVTIADPRSEALRHIAEVQAERGMLAAARETIGGIGEAHARADALKGLAVAQARADNLDAARATIDEIDKEFSNTRARAWAEIAIERARKGDIQGAVLVLEQMNQLASADHKFLAPMNEAAAEITVMLAADGDLERVAQINRFRWTGSIYTEVGYRADEAIAIAMARRGNLAGALELAREIAVPEIVARALGEIARSALQGGQLGAVQSAALQLRDKAAVARAQAQIALAQADAGHRDAREALREAAETVGLVQEVSERRDTFVDIAVAQELAGFSQDSRKTFTQALALTEDRDDKDEVRQTFIRRLSEAGRIPQALDQVTQINSPYRRGSTLWEMAGRHTSSGLLDQILRAAREMPYRPEGWMPQMADALTKLGDKAGFKGLLVLGSGDLVFACKMCGLLAQLYPEKSDAIARELG